jgi:hypothetical protein
MHLTILSGGYGYDKPIVVEHGWENDLHFGMRASGGSFGIITEFLYKVINHFAL